MNKLILLVGAVFALLILNQNSKIEDLNKEISTLSSQLIVNRVPAPDGTFVTIISSDNFKLLKKKLEEK